MSTAADWRYMDTAIALAIGQLGRTAPNPSVGCVLVRDHRIIGAAATADRGRPHAEPQALEQAGDAARGATAFVTLEPCAFHGQTPPCAETLVAAGVARVVIACQDQHPKVNGRGADILRAAGIEVATGLGEDRAHSLYEGFFHRMRTGRPMLYIDGRTRLYDAELDGRETADLDARLGELGESGFNRVCVQPGSPVARRMENSQS